MSDIINLAEQLMRGLRDFYLWNGFLHRDAKQENVLIDIA
jgi:hypothetical protein